MTSAREDVHRLMVRVEGRKDGNGTTFQIFCSKYPHPGKCPGRIRFFTRGAVKSLWVGLQRIPQNIGRVRGRVVGNFTGRHV